MIFSFIFIIIIQKIYFLYTTKFHLNFAHLELNLSIKMIYSLYNNRQVANFKIPRSNNIKSFEFLGQQITLSTTERGKLNNKPKISKMTNFKHFQLLMFGRHQGANLQSCISTHLKDVIGILSSMKLVPINSFNTFQVHYTFFSHHLQFKDLFSISIEHVCVKLH